MNCYCEMQYQTRDDCRLLRLHFLSVPVGEIAVILGLNTEQYSWPSNQCQLIMSLLHIDSDMWVQAGH